MLSPVDSRNHVAYIDGDTDPLWEGAILRGRACPDMSNDTLT